jgi:hypothetical protein
MVVKFALLCIAALTGSTMAQEDARPAATAGVAPSPGPAPASAAAPALLSSATVIAANPSNYLERLALLKPGQTLLLEAGNYGVDANGQDTDRPPGLPIFNLNGTESAPIIISGPESGPRPVLLGRADTNTVRLRNASHLIVRNIDIDNRGLGAQGVAAQGVTHHITLENLSIRGVGDHQATVGIAANNAPSWNWIIRGNRIVGAGTGMYLGNSDGSNPFVAGLIEGNLVVDTIGYNIQIKHQTPWGPMPAGFPMDRTRTIVRHNVLIKRLALASDAGPRPNLLVGDQPPAGPGADNGVEIYGNLLYRNPTEALFQGEGNISFHHNVLINDLGPAVRLQKHNGFVRNVQLFANTVVARDEGISLSGTSPGSVQSIVANAVFAATPLRAAGPGLKASDNMVAAFREATLHLNRPLGELGSIDVRPKPRALQGTPVDTTGFASSLEWDRDFDGSAYAWTSRGAYSVRASGPGWLPREEVKPRPAPP